MLRSTCMLVCALALLVAQTCLAEPVTLPLWPGTPPGDAELKLPPEADTTKPTDKLIADRPVVRLANVATPTLEVYSPEASKNSGVAVIICPGGGHRILAYDLEGTEVAAWLNTVGITGIVLKYRVPGRPESQRWLAAVQDAQRAVSVVRSRAAEWKINPQRIGIMGFSAGGETAGLAALLFPQRQYSTVDAADAVSCRPDFAALIYPGGFFEKDKQQLREHVRVPAEAPPFFFVHAFDDHVPVQNSLVLASELRRQKGSAELHIYAAGGHGYGLRRTQQPVTTWPDRMTDWLRSLQLLP